MKTRIEILVDAEIDVEDVERLRKHLEDLNWREVIQLAQVTNAMVQANEVPAPEAPLRIHSNRPGM